MEDFSEKMSPDTFANLSLGLTCFIRWRDIYLSLSIRIQYLAQLGRKHSTCVGLFLTELYHQFRPVVESLLGIPSPVRATRHPNSNLSQALINYTDHVYDFARASALSSHILAVFICSVGVRPDLSVTKIPVMDDDLEIVTSSSSLSRSLRYTKINKTTLK